MTDSKTLISETVKCLQALVKNGGKVSVSVGISGIAARYPRGTDIVLYGDEQFELAVQQGWLERTQQSSSQFDYTITLSGRQMAEQ